MSLSSSATIQSKPELSRLFTGIGLLTAVLLLVAFSFSLNLGATLPAMVGP